MHTCILNKKHMVITMYTNQTKYSNFIGVWQRYIVIIAVPMHFSQFYHVKSILRWVLETRKFWMPSLGQSLLLSTIILNDKSVSYNFENYKKCLFLYLILNLVFQNWSKTEIPKYTYMYVCMYVIFHCPGLWPLKILFYAWFVVNRWQFDFFIFMSLEGIKVHMLYSVSFTYNLVLKTIPIYRIRWKFGGEFILAVWRITKIAKLNSAKLSFLLPNACKIQ